MLRNVKQSIVQHAWSNIKNTPSREQLSKRTSLSEELGKLDDPFSQSGYFNREKLGCWGLKYPLYSFTCLNRRNKKKVYILTVYSRQKLSLSNLNSAQFDCPRAFHALRPFFNHHFIVSGQGGEGLKLWHYFGVKRKLGKCKPFSSAEKTPVFLPWSVYIGINEKLRARFG